MKRQVRLGSTDQVSIDSMTRWQIILAAVSFFMGIQFSRGQQFAPPAPPIVAPYTTPASPQPVFVPQQPYIQSSPNLIAPAPPAMTVFPPQSTVVPLPSHTPGSVFGPPPQPAPAGPMIVPGALPQPPLVVPEALPQPPIAAPGLVNPIVVPVVDEELAWDQIADVVSDYFTISREQRARRGGEVWSEGRIETAYQTGATWLEPHRGDSVGTFNRWESTFQTIRRRATIRVIPDARGYLVEAIVEKELEDLPNPEKATAGAVVFRNDGSLPSRRLEEVSRMRSSPRWLQLGRDPPLEQRMLAEIHARLSGAVAGSGSVFPR
jgi:hypothetical protein